MDATVQIATTPDAISRATPRRPDAILLATPKHLHKKEEVFTVRFSFIKIYLLIRV